jgi:ribonuclease HII
MKSILGVDESGRGPVVGPLIIVGLLFGDSDQEKLKKIKVRDSKLLTAKQREKLFDKILKIARQSKIMVISPHEIDMAVDGHEGMNLNWLEARKAAEIIDQLRPDEVVIDCPSPNIKAWVSYLEKRLKHKTKIVAEHKADVKYPVVSAASIIAKVTRDKEVAKIQEMIDEPIGSGYPSDPTTVEFLKRNYAKHRNIFRKSWVTYKLAEEGKKQRKLDEF